MVTAKVNAPNYQAYDPTDLEKVFAQQMFTNPDLGGSAFAMLGAATADRYGGVDRYTRALADSNALQVALARQEMSNELNQTALKELAPLVNAGVPIADIPLAAQFSATQGNNPQLADASLAVVLKRKADANEANAKALASALSGQPQTTQVTTLGPGGTPGTMVVTTKGHNAPAVFNQNTGMVRNQMVQNFGAKPGPFIYQTPNAVQNRQAQLTIGENGAVSLRQ